MPALSAALATETPLPLARTLARDELTPSHSTQSSAGRLMTTRLPRCGLRAALIGDLVVQTRGLKPPGSRTVEALARQARVSSPTELMGSVDVS